MSLAQPRPARCDADHQASGGSPARFQLLRHYALAGVQAALKAHRRHDAAMCARILRALRQALRNETTERPVAREPIDWPAVLRRAKANHLTAGDVARELEVSVSTVRNAAARRGVKLRLVAEPIVAAPAARPPRQVAPRAAQPLPIVLEGEAPVPDLPAELAATLDSAVAELEGALPALASIATEAAAEDEAELAAEAATAAIAGMLAELEEDEPAVPCPAALPPAPPLPPATAEPGAWPYEHMTREQAHAAADRLGQYKRARLETQFLAFRPVNLVAAVSDVDPAVVTAAYQQFAARSVPKPRATRQVHK